MRSTASRKNDLEVVLESDIELTAVGRAPFIWDFPVSFAHDIQVSLDGVRLPIAIAPGSARGSVSIAEAGDHRLRIRRSVASAAENGRATISVPVNAMPSARVVVEPGADGRQDGEVNARGSVALEADHSLIGRLGPAEKVEVHWQKATDPAGERSRGTLEGLILWDITPAGDRVRRASTCHQPAGLATIRVAHQEGLILRSAQAPGSVETFCEEKAGKGEWIVHVDPPLKAGSTVELDCWLPSGETRADAGKSHAVPATLSGSIHECPRLRPIGVERYFGAVGVRRPGDWTGRFDPLPDTDPITDESFVESWGGRCRKSRSRCAGPAVSFTNVARRSKPDRFRPKFRSSPR